MIEVFKWKEGINKGDISEVLKMKEEGITRSNGFKLDKFKFKKDIGNYWFGNRFVDLWNSLPPAVINSNLVDSFKTRYTINTTFLPGGRMALTAAMSCLEGIGYNPSYF